MGKSQYVDREYETSRSIHVLEWGVDGGGWGAGIKHRGVKMSPGEAPPKLGRQAPRWRLHMHVAVLPELHTAQRDTLCLSFLCINTCLGECLGNEGGIGLHTQAEDASGSMPPHAQL